MDLSHLIYVSASTERKLGIEEVKKFVNGCRPANESIDVTGMLIFIDGAFFQVLEGDRPVIEALFDKISMDKRHRRVTKLVAESIPEREFSEWSMGLSHLSASEIAKIPGLKSFFANGKSLLEMEEGRAKELLSAFSAGKWRSTLN